MRKRRRLRFLSRCLAVFLAVSLILPNPAFALRQTGLEESDKVKKDFVTALLASNSPDAAAQNLVGQFSRAVGLPPSTPLAAGLEERTFSNPIERAVWLDLDTQMILIDPARQKFQFDLGEDEDHLVRGQEWWVHAHFDSGLRNGVFLRLQLSPEGQLLGVNHILAEPSAVPYVGKPEVYQNYIGLGRILTETQYRSLLETATQFALTHKDGLETAIGAALAKERSGERGRYDWLVEAETPGWEGVYRQVEYGLGKAKDRLEIPLSVTPDVHVVFRVQHRPTDSAAGLEERNNPEVLLNETGIFEGLLSDANDILLELFRNRKVQDIQFRPPYPMTISDEKANPLDRYIEFRKQWARLEPNDPQRMQIERDGQVLTFTFAPYYPRAAGLEEKLFGEGFPAAVTWADFDGTVTVSGRADASEISRQAIRDYKGASGDYRIITARDERTTRARLGLQDVQIYGRYGSKKLMPLIRKRIHDNNGRLLTTQTLREALESEAGPSRTLEGLRLGESMLPELSEDVLGRNPDMEILRFGDFRLYQFRDVPNEERIYAMIEVPHGADGKDLRPLIGPRLPRHFPGVLFTYAGSSTINLSYVDKWDLIEAESIRMGAPMEWAAYLGDAGGPGEPDEKPLREMARHNGKAILVNSPQMHDRFLQVQTERLAAAKAQTVDSKTNIGIQELKDMLETHLPWGFDYYDGSLERSSYMGGHSLIPYQKPWEDSAMLESFILKTKRTRFDVTLQRRVPGVPLPAYRSYAIIVGQPAAGLEEDWSTESVHALPDLARLVVERYRLNALTDYSLVRVHVTYLKLGQKDSQADLSSFINLIELTAAGKGMPLAEISQLSGFVAFGFTLDATWAGLYSDPITKGSMLAKMDPLLKQLDQARRDVRWELTLAQEQVFESVAMLPQEQKKADSMTQTVVEAIRNAIRWIGELKQDMDSMTVPPRLEVTVDQMQLLEKRLGPESKEMRIFKAFIERRDNLIEGMKVGRLHRLTAENREIFLADLRQLEQWAETFDMPIEVQWLGSYELGSEVFHPLTIGISQVVERIQQDGSGWINMKVARNGSPEVLFLPAAAGLEEDFSEFMGKKLYAVHATNFYPGGGIVKTHWDATRGGYARHTVHWALNHVVAPVPMGGDWHNMKHYIVVPLQELVAANPGQVMGGTTVDFYFLENLKLPTSARIFSSKEEVDEYLTAQKALVVGGHWAWGGSEDVTREWQKWTQERGIDPAPHAFHWTAAWEESNEGAHKYYWAALDLLHRAPAALPKPEDKVQFQEALGRLLEQRGMPAEANRRYLPFLAGALQPPDLKAFIEGIAQDALSRNIVEHGTTLNRADQTTLFRRVVQEEVEFVGHLTADAILRSLPRSVSRREIEGFLDRLKLGASTPEGVTPADTAIRLAMARHGVAEEDSTSRVKIAELMIDRFEAVQQEMALQARTFLENLPPEVTKEILGALWARSASGQPLDKEEATTEGQILRLLSSEGVMLANRSYLGAVLEEMGRQFDSVRAEMEKKARVILDAALGAGIAVTPELLNSFMGVEIYHRPSFAYDSPEATIRALLPVGISLTELQNATEMIRRGEADPKDLELPKGAYIPVYPREKGVAHLEKMVAQWDEVRKAVDAEKWLREQLETQGVDLGDWGRAESMVSLIRSLPAAGLEEARAVMLAAVEDIKDEWKEVSADPPQGSLVMGFDSTLRNALVSGASGDVWVHFHHRANVQDYRQVPGFLARLVIREGGVVEAGEVSIEPGDPKRLNTGVYVPMEALDAGVFPVGVRERIMVEVQQFIRQVVDPRARELVPASEDLQRGLASRATSILARAITDEVPLYLTFSATSFDSQGEIRWFFRKPVAKPAPEGEVGDLIGQLVFRRQDLPARLEENRRRAIQAREEGPTRKNILFILGMLEERSPQLLVSAVATVRKWVEDPAFRASLVSLTFPKERERMVNLITGQLIPGITSANYHSSLIVLEKLVRTEGKAFHGPLSLSFQALERGLAEGQVSRYRQSGIQRLLRIMNEGGIHPNLPSSPRITAAHLAPVYRIVKEAGQAIQQARLEGVRQTSQGHILYKEATLAALFFLHLPSGELSPNVAVVDPNRREALRVIAAEAGFSERWIATWQRDYLVEYDGTQAGERAATERAEAMIRQRFEDAGFARAFQSAIEPIKDLPSMLNEFGPRLRAILESFGLSFQSGTLNDGVIEALYKAAQA